MRVKPLKIAMGVGMAAAGLWFLFLHLMQRWTPFAETVAKISPDIANRYSCSCPFCSGQACLPPADQQGIERFHGNYPI